MNDFKHKTLDLKSMSDILGGADSITHDTTIHLSKKTKEATHLQDKTIEITGTITIDRER